MWEPFLHLKRENCPKCGIGMECPVIIGTSFVISAISYLCTLSKMLPSAALRSYQTDGQTNRQTTLINYSYELHISFHISISRSLAYLRLNSVGGYLEASEGWDCLAILFVGPQGPRDTLGCVDHRDYFYSGLEEYVKI